jgi:hypothetical protein
MTMTSTVIAVLLAEAEGDTFTRIAYLNFNAVTGQFGYVSLDSRRDHAWDG